MTSTLFNQQKELKNEARFTWLCGLVSPPVFFIALYLTTILFSAFIGMTCGGGISVKCPVPILQAFASFSSMDLKKKRDAIENWDLTGFSSSKAAMLIFSWVALLSSAIGLFGFRQARFFAFYGRKVLDDVRCQIYPLYYLIPSILVYVFSFVLLLFWTHFVLYDQLSGVTNVKPEDVAPLLFFTLLPLITVWAVAIYIAFGLAKSVCYLHALCSGWFDTSTPPRRMSAWIREIRSSRGTFSAPGSRLNSFRRSKRRSTRSLGNININTVEAGEVAAAEPLNRSYASEDGTETWRSQKLEVIEEEETNIDTGEVHD
uniref:Transmembrane protein n=1 Tax=Panagrellus redivivus TaxID=6233 RepID=A0A7E4UQ28_PANRE